MALLYFCVGGLDLLEATDYLKIEDSKERNAILAFVDNALIVPDTNANGA
jgi:hypothetical protein